ncbi:hypothetical protein UFOVP609_5 [uncultured Caudovirales phage]|uniref:Uncharacterized protein n=1 Tax=uncultured Caudovirales phage TaxID=2100421 RepID=A0A6J5N514_9CAUD|nr:hypothetical protein UFOVP609_5 [uncultured Caudovirales phage]
MAQISFPFENVDTSETQYSALFSYFQDNAIAGDPVTAGTLDVQLTTGLGVKVTSGFAIIRGFAYQNTSDVALTLDTANAQPRIDTVILRLDPSVNSIVAAVKKGTAAASPSAPALTQTPGGIWEMPLDDILVPASATSLSPGNIIADRRMFLGSQVGVWWNESRPTAPAEGRIGFNTSLNKFEYWTGSAWSTSLPIDITLGTGSVTNDMLAGSIADDKLVTPPGRYRSVSASAATAFTVSNNERGRLVTTSSSSAVTITVNTGLVAGDRIDFIQEGTGQITFVAGSGVTLLSSGSKFKTKGQYSAVTVVAVALNTLRLIGDTVA